MTAPALLRRLPPLRDRPPRAADALGERIRDRVVDGTRLATDVAAIRDVLVPRFQEADAGAISARNRWARRELWLLVLSGLLAVASSIQAAYGSDQQWPSVVVAALGGVSSVLAGAAKSTDARGAYLRARREAERLRSLAWTHLTLVDPVDPEARVRTLRKGVARIRLQTVEGSGETEAEAPGDDDRDATREKPTAVRSDPSSEHLVDLYLLGRLSTQRGWYRRRQAEFDAAELQGGRIRTAMLVVATVFGALSAPEFAGDYRAALGVAATAVTAASAITTGWMRLQAFDTRARLYELTAARLDVAEADRPAAVDPALAAQYIAQCENVILAEHGAWTTQTPRGAREPPPGPKPDA